MEVKLEGVCVPMDCAAVSMGSAARLVLTVDLVARANAATTPPAQLVLRVKTIRMNTRIMVVPTNELTILI